MVGGLKLAAHFVYIIAMRTGLKVNVVRVINISVVSVFDRTLLMTVGLYRPASAPSSWRTNTAVVRLSRQINCSLVVIRRLNPSHLYLAPLFRETPLEFRKDFCHQKTRVPGLSCGFVCVILSVAVLIQYRLVTDRHTDRQTDKGRQLLPR